MFATFDNGAVNLILRVSGDTPGDMKRDPGNKVAYYTVYFLLMLHVHVIRHMLNSSFWHDPI